VAVPYLGRPPVQALIFGAFPLLALPVAYLTLRPPSAGWRWLPDVYVAVFSTSHFLITFTVYLNARNLEHFRSSVRNRIIYFAIPLLIFVYFALAWWVDRQAHPVLDGVIQAVTFVTPLAQYTHLGRQSFGVLQIFKRQSGVLFPALMRRLEQAFFWVLPVMQAQTTFLGEGRFAGQSRLVWATLALAGVLLAAILIIGLTARRPEGRGPLARAIPLAYLCMQTASQCLSVANMRLWPAGDAVHYAEYHALMYRRVVRPGQSEARGWPDRLMNRLRRFPAVFYAMLLVISAFAVCFYTNRFGVRAWVDRGPMPFAVVLHLLNGIFLFHFFVEAFIWKFRNPFYQSTLGPLYFGR
jgi:hypothetical protein